MAKTQTQATLSPLQLTTGREIYLEDARTVAEQQNYTFGYSVATYFSLVTAAAGWQDTGDQALETHETYFPASASFSTYYTVPIFINADVDQVQFGGECTVAATNTCQIRITVGGAAPQTVDFTNANNGTEKTADFVTSSTGTGWQTVTLELARSVGASATNQLKALRLEAQVITTGLPSPPDE